MLKIRSLRNQYQKRLIRPLYAQTQATPYAATIDPRFRTSDGSAFNFAQTVDSVNYGTFLTEGTSLQKGSLVPGTVMLNKYYQGSGEVCVPSAGPSAAAARALGLLANFVGGQLDDLGDDNYIGVWRGPDSVYEILRPGFNPGDGGAGVPTTVFAAATALTGPVPLYAGADGRLAAGVNTGNQVVAYLLEAFKNRIIVDLKI
jgi:hypothetical protein